MSKSHASNIGRSRMLRLENGYAGWMGESCWRQRGRAFIKKIEHRSNRRFAKKLISSELLVHYLY